jgi:hypothetical protein
MWAGDKPGFLCSMQRRDFLAGQLPGLRHNGSCRGDWRNRSRPAVRRQPSDLTVSGNAAFWSGHLPA